MAPRDPIRARSAGIFLGDRWSGTVLATFPGAINILRHDGMVVSLVEDTTDLTACSALVPPLFAHPLQGLDGRNARCAKGVLALGNGIAIDLDGAEPWPGRIEAPAGLHERAGLLSLLRGALIAYGRPGGMIGLLDPVRANAYSEPARDALTQTPPRLEALVGLGPGLTPAGDDFLAGVLLADALLGMHRRMRAISARLGSTTPAGRTLLWLALRRSFPAYLLACARSALEPQERRRVRAAIRNTCLRGETSGTDALVGLAWRIGSSTHAVES